MNQDVHKNLFQVSQFLNIPVQEIQTNDKELPLCNLAGKKIAGYINIINELLKKSSVLQYNNDIEILQWLEYGLTYASKLESSQNSRQILEELNGVLAHRTFLACNSLTVADVALYYYVHNTLSQISYLDKERLLNLSRWFDNLQQNEKLRNNLETIKFGTNYLSLIVPAKT